MGCVAGRRCPAPRFPARDSHQTPPRHPGSSSTVSLPRLRVGRSQRLRQVHRAVRLRVRLSGSRPGAARLCPQQSLPQLRSRTTGGTFRHSRGNRTGVRLCPGWRELRHGLEKGKFLQMGSQLPGPKRWKTTATGTIPSHSRESHQSVGGARPSATCSKAVSDGRTYA